MLLPSGRVRYTTDLFTSTEEAPGADHLTLCRLDRRRGAAVALPGGRYAMGWSGGTANQKPVHEVQVGPFRIMKTEVAVNA